MHSEKERKTHNIQTCRQRFLFLLLFTLFTLSLTAISCPSSLELLFSVFFVTISSPPSLISPCDQTAIPVLPLPLVYVLLLFRCIVSSWVSFSLLFSSLFPPLHSLRLLLLLFHSSLLSLSLHFRAFKFPLLFSRRGPLISAFAAEKLPFLTFSIRVRGEEGTREKREKRGTASEGRMRKRWPGSEAGRASVGPHTPC